MFQQATTILILTAITVQAVFGGLQNSVSICLGGGHEHEVAEVVEHCEMECSHSSQWATPIVDSEDFNDCQCTDLELNLITLLSTLRNADEGIITLSAFENLTSSLSEGKLQTSLRGPPEYSSFDIPAKRQQLVVVRTTRFLL
ncbi:hypothetical protein H8D29_01010 [PVC group bacterium]|nr:hypothetical protein [PVC group bacterium]